MANEKTKQTRTKDIQLFPMTVEAIETISKLFYDFDEEKYNTELTGAEKEIVDRPMLYLAQKMCSEFGIWTVDLIKYMALLDGMDLQVDNGGWFIKIKGENDEG